MAETMDFRVETTEFLLGFCAVLSLGPGASYLNSL